jgi:hypothetical protein
VSKNHLSVFPFSPEAVDAARAELAGFQQLLRHRLREIEGR